MRRALNEIAIELGLNLDTLDRWIRQGKIPVNKRGDMGIYNESELHRWAEKHRKTQVNHQDEHDIVQEDLYDNTKSSSVLLSALKRGGIFHGITGNSKDAVINAAVDMIPDFHGKNRDEIYNQLMERERLASTGIGKGVAIPHPRNPITYGLTESMIVTCFLEKSVNFESVDDRPVSVLFLLLSTTIEQHLNLLSRLSFCLRDSDFMAFVLQKPDADLLLNRIREMENNIDKRDI